MPAMPMSQQEISAAVTGLGWRYVLGVLCTWIPAGSLGESASLATRVAAAAGDGADAMLSIDVRRDRVLLSVRLPPGTPEPGVALVRRLTGDLAEFGLGAGLGSRLDPDPDPDPDPDLDPDPGPGSGTEARPRAVQQLEIAIDAIDIPAVRPFWKAVLGYVDQPGDSPTTGGLVDPLAQGPQVWFQQMDAPRPQRNRIHFDVSVPHDAAPGRVQATLAAGGTLVSDAAAPAFWVLADAEGNEACVCTWQGRD